MEDLFIYLLGCIGECEGPEYGDDNRRGETSGEPTWSSGQIRTRRRLCQQVGHEAHPLPNQE